MKQRRCQMGQDGKKQQISQKRMRFGATMQNTLGSAGRIPGNCNETAQHEPDPPLPKSSPSPPAATTSIKAYSNRWDSLAASTCTPGRSAGNGGWRVAKRTNRRTTTSNRMAIPKGLLQIEQPFMPLRHRSRHTCPDKQHGNNHQRHQPVQQAAPRGEMLSGCAHGRVSLGSWSTSLVRRT
ncbi:Uncharacterised protein [Pseudomonas fragi]|uniref:Uncharacterized protein n=1 Tax=Pseudomonas fragi TaxID=296 RepID=A0A449IGK7_PSEFR|nr:Uncharacterised protein [Pseudomonas fragi]